MKKLIFPLVAVAALIAMPAQAGLWHSGQNLLCTDCHTMHFSQSHNFDGTTPVPTTPAPNGNWLGATGPNQYLLKLPANQLCLACHDGQTFAPDVFEVNINPSPTQGRSAGALNDVVGAAPYQTWKGHTLGSTDVPPGYNPAVVGAPPTWYDPTQGLSCINCHSQHGSATAYRNLGSYSLGGAATAARPTFVVNTANDTTKDVWVAIPNTYTPNSGNSATFNPYYDTANVSFNRIDATVGTTLSSNRMDVFCATCHGNFHGGPGDASIGASAAALEGFLRHPTAQVVIGASGTQGYGGHTSLAQYMAGATRVRVYADDRVAYTDAVPGCVTCHKAHGNQNPFGLNFLSRHAATVTEEGGYATGQVENANGYQQAYRNLCGQCHSQGN